MTQERLFIFFITWKIFYSTADTGLIFCSSLTIWTSEFQDSRFEIITDEFVSEKTMKFRFFCFFFIFDTENNCLTSIIIMWKSSRKSLVRVDSFPLFSKGNSRSQYNYLFRFFPATKTLRFMKLFLTNWFKQAKKEVISVLMWEW